MGCIVTCGICGFMLEEGDLESGLKHIAYHTSWSPLKLPQPVRDLIRYWADKVLRAATEDITPQQLHEVDVARWVLMHMWYSDEDVREPDRQVAFERYQRTIRKMYPNLSNLSFRFVGEGGG